MAQAGGTCQPSGSVPGLAGRVGGDSFRVGSPAPLASSGQSFEVVVVRSCSRFLH